MRLHPASAGGRRRGVAVVELAVVLPLLLLVLIGIWELGRIINVQITLNDAAREAARLGAQANMVNTFGNYTQVRFGTGAPDIDGTVRAYLRAAGITNQTGLVIEFQFVEPAVSAPDADPYTGVKNQRFRVRIQLPYDNVRWTTLSLINPTTLTAETYWQCLVDDPFTVNTTLPGWSP